MLNTRLASAMPKQANVIESCSGFGGWRTAGRSDGQGFDPLSRSAVLLEQAHDLLLPRFRRQAKSTFEFRA
jgi:hypothetical protein